MRENKQNRWRFCLLLCVLALLITGCGLSSDQSSTAEYLNMNGTSGEQEEQDGYRTAQVYVGDIEFTAKASGFTRYMEYASLTWDHSGDRYGEVLVQQGQFVKKGDVLATFEVTSVSDADIMAAELAVEEAASRIAQLQEQYEARIAGQRKSLSGQTGRDYQLANLELQQTQNEYAQQMDEARHQLERQQKNLKDLTERKGNNQLVAPFDAEVFQISRDFQKGDKVDIGIPIVVLGNVNTRIIEVDGTDHFNYLAEVAVMDMRDESILPGTVISTPGVGGSYKVALEGGISNELANDYFTVFATEVHHDVLLVDILAVHWEGSANFVNVVNEDGFVHKTYVDVGGTVGKEAWIMGGLEEGQTVVLN